MVKTGRRVRCSGVKSSPGLDPGVGAHQVEQASRYGRRASSRVTGSASPRAKTSRPSWSRAHQPRAGVAHRLEPLQLEGEVGGELVAGGLLAGRVGRQQQARLQVGEPGGHHQVVGGELDPQPLRRLDEGQVLLGEAQDRDPAEVDLLAARERQQHVERALVAVERRRRAPRRRAGRVTASASKKSSGTRQPSERRRARRRAPRCRLAASWRSASAAGGARAAASPASAGTPRRRPRPSRPGRRCSAGPRRSRPRARAPARSAKPPSSAFIDRSSVISSPSKPISSRISRTTAGDWVAGRVRVDGRVDHVGRHRHRQVGERPERREVAPPAPRAAPRPAAASRWLSSAARPCPGMCFITGSTPPASEPLGDGAADRRDLRRDRRRRRGCRITACVSGPARSSTGAQFDVDADGGELGGDQPVAQPHRPRPQVAVGQRAAGVERRRATRARPARAAGRRGRPPGRSAPARRGRRCRAGRRSAARSCAGVRDVAREEDEAPGLGRRRRSAAPPSAEAGPRAAEDDGAGRPSTAASPGCRRSPRARSDSHICRVWSALVKPATRSR